MKKMYLFALLALSTLSFGQTNLISNGDFDTNITGWTISGGVSRTTTNTRTGAGALLFSTGFRSASQPFTAVQGTVYVGTYYVRTNEATVASLLGSTDGAVYVSINDASNVALVPPITSLNAPFSSVANGYLKYTFTFTAPQANLILSMSKGSGGSTINLDDISIVAGATTTLTETGSGPYIYDFQAATTRSPSFTATPVVAITNNYRGISYNNTTAPINAGNYSAVPWVANGTGRDYLVVPFVIRGTPTISTAPSAGFVALGSALSTSTTLTGGVASVAGTFAFTNGSTVPSLGTTAQSVTFTPTDTTNFTTATTTTSVITGQSFGWNTSTMPGGSNNFGTLNFNTTHKDNNLTTTGFSRGSGFTTPSGGTGVARGWGGATSNTVAIADKAAALAASQFFTFTVKPTSAGTTMSLHSIDPFSYRRSSNGPSAGVLQYATDGSTFVDIGSVISFSSTAAGGATLASPISLSGIADLQNVTSATTVTFRLVLYGSTTSTNAGVFYIFDTAISTQSDLSFQGTVCVTPAVPTASNLTVAFDGAAKSVTATVGSGNTVDWYTVPTGGSPVLSNSLTSPVNTIAGTYTYYAEARNTNSGCSLVSTTRTTVVITIASTTTWSSGAWSVGAPTALLDAVIADTYSTTTNGAISANNLTVNATRTLTVNSSAGVTVAGAVSNSGIINVANNANFVQTAVNNTNTGSGAFNVSKNSNSLFRLDYTLWSSPVTSPATLLSFSPLTSARTPIRFFTYSSAANNFVVAAPETDTFTAGRGYLIRMPNENPNALGLTTPYYLGSASITYTGSFSGTPNNGTITAVASATANSVHGVGNPYPSTISADTFITANGGASPLYFWREKNATAGTAYSTYTLAGGTVTTNSGGITPNGTIQVGQGFIVKAGNTGSIVFTNAMRTSSSSTTFFKTKKETEKSRVWLSVSNDKGGINQALVAYMDGATNGFDTGIDGKYISDLKTALNSVVDNDDYVIQGRPAFDAADEVALSFKTDVAGSYTIALDKFDGLFEKGQAVYLLDRMTGVETDLKAGSYTFTAAAVADMTRFVVKYQKTLKVDAPAFNESSVKVFRNNGSIMVSSTAKAIKSVQVYDVQGRLVAQLNNVKSNTARINNVKVANQMLVVKVSTEDNLVVSKKILN